MVDPRNKTQSHHHRLDLQAFNSSLAIHTLIVWLWLLLKHHHSLISPMKIVPSEPALAMIGCAGWNATSLTLPVWPGNR